MQCGSLCVTWSYGKASIAWILHVFDTSGVSGYLVASAWRSGDIHLEYRAWRGTAEVKENDIFRIMYNKVMIVWSSHEPFYCYFHWQICD